MYFFLASEKPAWMKKANPEATARRLWEKHIDRINSMIEAQEFDLLFFDRWTKIPPVPDSYGAAKGSELLSKYYRLREKTPVYLAPRPGGRLFKVQVWEPIPKSSSGDTTAH